MLDSQKLTAKYQGRQQLWRRNIGSEDLLPIFSFLRKLDKADENTFCSRGLIRGFYDMLFNSCDDKRMSLKHKFRFCTELFKKTTDNSFYTSFKKYQYIFLIQTFMLSEGHLYSAFLALKALIRPIITQADFFRATNTNSVKWPPALNSFCSWIENWKKTQKQILQIKSMNV